MLLGKVLGVGAVGLLQMGIWVGTVYMVGDWTNQDIEISAFLDEYRAPGVPLYVVYPANGGPGVKLPQLLSLELMRESLEAAAK